MFRPDKIFSCIDGTPSALFCIYLNTLRRDERSQMADCLSANFTLSNKSQVPKNRTYSLVTSRLVALGKTNRWD